MKKDIQQLLKAEAKAILNIPVTENIEKTIELIFQYIHNKGGKIIAWNSNRRIKSFLKFPFKFKKFYFYWIFNLRKFKISMGIYNLFFKR